jgi:hypothetical protein
MTAIEEPLPVALRRTHDALRQLNRECDCGGPSAGGMAVTCERCAETIAATGLLEAAATRLEALDKLHDRAQTTIEQQARFHHEAAAIWAKRLVEVEAERDEARDWVRRMTRDERTLTCVYCGHAYPPGSPTHSAEVLTAHVAVCPKHPMAAVVKERDELRARLLPEEERLKLTGDALQAEAEAYDLRGQLAAVKAERDQFRAGWERTSALLVLRSGG